MLYLIEGVLPVPSTSGVPPLGERGYLVEVCLPCRGEEPGLLRCAQLLLDLRFQMSFQSQRHLSEYTRDLQLLDGPFI